MARANKCLEFADKLRELAQESVAIEANTRHKLLELYREEKGLPDGVCDLEDLFVWAGEHNDPEVRLIFVECMRNFVSSWENLQSLLHSEEFRQFRLRGTSVADQHAARAEDPWHSAVVRKKSRGMSASFRKLRKLTTGKLPSELRKGLKRIREFLDGCGEQ